MARPTRQQRRERRQAQAASAEAAAQRGRAQRQPLRPLEEVRADGGRREPPRRLQFFRESWGELQKVDWPGRPQVVTGTIVVVIACAIVGGYLWLADLAFKNLVEDLILRGG
jgi:preprotein translocase SecE subunit